MNQRQAKIVDISNNYLKLITLLLILKRELLISLTNKTLYFQMKANKKINSK